MLARIRSGAFPVGALLPSGRELMAAYGVGRVTVLEALQSLERVGRSAPMHAYTPFLVLYSKKRYDEPTADERKALGECAIAGRDEQRRFSQAPTPLRTGQSMRTGQSK